MSRTERSHWLFTAMVLILVAWIGVEVAAETGAFRVFSMNPESLTRARRRASTGDKAVMASVNRLQRDADKVMQLAIVSVMDKKVIPPSGDKHDYLSYGRYFWPDPSTPDGLPYIRRDGETNPEIIEVSDQENLQQVFRSTHTLGLAYFFTAKEKYAEHATTILRTWFLDPETRMNPNVNFGQMVKGTHIGRASGLIDMRGFALLVDGVGLLNGSESWSADNHRALVSWFTEYLNWLETSEIGKKEAQAVNNHGVWFDVQRVSIAMFVGKIRLARTVLEEAKTKRIAMQIEPDGSMPRELERTRSMHYTAFNIEAFVSLAQLGEKAGVDLWSYQTSDGRSIRKALDWFMPYYSGEREWTYKQIDTYDKEALYPALLLASQKFIDPTYWENGLRNAGDKAKTDRANLMYGTL